MQRSKISRRRWLKAGAAWAMLGWFGAAPGWGAAPGDKPEKILFVSNRAGEKRLNIFTMNPDGSEQTNLTKSDAMEFDPVWSPDHTRIAFAVADPAAHSADIYVMQADGSQRTKLTQSAARTLALGPAWSPDGKRIAYSTMQQSQGGAQPQTAVYLMDADGKNNQKIGAGLLPAWSPDGKKIVNTVDNKNGSVPGLFIMDADGSNLKPLAEKGLGASWSPDGKRLLYISEGGGDQPDLFVMNADGSQITQLTKTPGEMEFGAQWSTDGKQIFFTRFPKPTAGFPKLQVYVMDSDGTHVKPLTQGEASSFLGTGAALLLVLPRVAQAG